jgi:hypothetical protein
MASPFELLLPFIPWFIIVALILAMLVAFWMLGAEGRFFLSRAFFNPGGIDLAEYNPLTGTVELSVIKWDGEHWLRGKKQHQDGIWFGFKNLTTPLEGDDDKTKMNQINEAMASKSTWKGCRRPVLLNNQAMNFIFTPKMAAEFTRASKEAGLGAKEAKTAAQHIQSIFDSAFTKTEAELAATPETLAAFKYLRGFHKAGVKSLNVEEPIDATTIQKYLKGQTARQVNDVRDEGITIGQLNMSRPKGKPFKMPWVIIIIGIIALVVIGGVLYLIQSGALNNLIPLGK